MIYEFNNCNLDVARQELRRGGAPVAVEPQVLGLLQYLIRNRDRVVSKEELLTNIWNGRFVSDSTLSSRISTARKVIGDNGDQQQLIRTVARRGVRFVGQVEETALSRKGNEVQAPRTGVPARPDRPSIAVLPFTNMSGDPEQEYFSDGVTEDVITALSRLPWFFVIARNSTFIYKGTSVDVRDVGNDLGVQYVLEGSVQRSGQRVRISGQLIDASTRNHIWAEKYDRELNDIFALQDEIATSVAASIESTLLEEEVRKLVTNSSENLEAWDLVARALSNFWKLTSVHSEVAISLLQQAVERYPSYARAHSLLSFSLLIANHMGWRRSADDSRHAEHLARRAAELDENDSWAQMTLGYLAFVERRTDDAVRYFRAAIDLNPGFAAAYGCAGWALAHDGRSADAIEYLQRAIRMSPRDPFNVLFLAGLAAAYYIAGSYNEAIDCARQAIQLRPEHLGARRKLCASLAQAGLVEEASIELDQLRKMQPELSLAWVEKSIPYTPVPMAHFLEGLSKAGLVN